MACKVEKGKFVVPCKGLASVAEPMLGKKPRRGVIDWTYHKVAGFDLAPSRRFFGVASGAHTAKGICFNYCPFCGTDISAPFNPEEASKPAPKRKAA